MSTATQMTKQAVHEKIESQITKAQAKLEQLKAKAESAKANAELKLIADLMTTKQSVARKVDELKRTNDAAYEHTKADVESRVVELEKSVDAIERKLNAR